MAGELEAVKAWPKATKDYIDELKLEMRRVTWPTRKQVEATTTVVIICVFAFAAYFKIVDTIIGDTVTKPSERSLSKQMQDEPCPPRHRKIRIPDGRP